MNLSPQDQPRETAQSAETKPTGLDTPGCHQGHELHDPRKVDRSTLQTVINVLQEAIIVADRDGVIVEVNAGAEKLLNVQREQVIGQAITELPGSEICDRFKSIIAAFVSDPNQAQHTISCRFGDRWLNVYLSALKGEDKRFKGIVASFVDVTEQKKLEEKQRSMELDLLQHNKLSAIGMLASGIAHNLNGPLSVIVGYLDLLYSRFPNLQEIPLILSQTERMKEIIRNMMIKSRHEQDNQSRSVDLNALLQNELRFMEANLEFKHRVDKHYEFASGLPLIEGIYSDFSQTFLNIINNALDAMVDSPVKNLFIRTSYDDENIYVEFRDTGCGLNPQDMDKLFSPFYSTKPPVGEAEPGRPCGTGLGLSSAHQLMSKYGGSIKAEGKAGEGARFVVIIPIEKNRPGRPKLRRMMPMEEADSLVRIPV